MEIIENKTYKKLDLEKYGLDKDSCFLDIETTGLDRNRDRIYLIGIIYFDMDINAWILNQIFAENLEEEREILLESVLLLKKYNKIINYNGDAFDIPFLNLKFKHHNVDYFIKKDRSFDIYRIIRFNKMFLNLENLKLKTIEKYLGIERDDIYSGGDCIEFYLDYVATRDKGLKQRVLNHNMDDLWYMLDIIKILEVLKNKKTFEVYLSDRDTPYEFCIDRIEFEKEFLIVKGSLDRAFHRDIRYYNINYFLQIEDNSFSVSLETYKALVSPNKIGNFVYLNEYIENYKNRALVLRVEKNFIVENIKGFLKILIERSIKI